MKKTFSLIIISIFLFFCPVITLAATNPLDNINNKFGIHLLEVTELEEAAKLINSSGGDWGYVTIPIQNNDKDQIKWQGFMNDCYKYHLIPILRLATTPEGPLWLKPNPYDLVDFANFLNSLDWPTKNRYLIIFNEPNRAEEWGGEVNPAEYSRILSEAIEIFKKRNSDFFILNAGLDAAAPNNHVLMNSYDFMKQMNDAVPGIFNNLDGWNSHSYPNPNFSALPLENRKNTISGYKYEIDFLKNYLGVKKLPVFITETGWKTEKYSEDEVANFFTIAFQNVWTEKDIVAITPFLLQAGTEPFIKFSFLDKDGKPNKIYQNYQNLKKDQGNPEITNRIISPVHEKKKEKIELIHFKNINRKVDYQFQVQMWKNIFEWFLVPKN